MSVPDAKCESAAGVVVADVTSDELDGAALLRQMTFSAAGAAVVFEGRVRDHNHGRTVVGLHYDAYEEMASGVLTDIAHEAMERFEASAIGVRHRTGSLIPGEISLVVATLAPHRAQAFDASRYVVEELKRRVPIWKKEEYVDGTSGWLGGHGARPGARESGADR